MSSVTITTDPKMKLSRGPATGTKPASAFATTVATIATTSRIIMTSPINLCRSMSRCRVPKISVSANSMVEKMLLALQSKPPMDTMPNQPADALTPCIACCSSP